MVKVLGRDAAAGVRDLKPDPGALLHAGQGRVLASVHILVLQREAQIAAFRHGVARVEGQVK